MTAYDNIPLLLAALEETTKLLEIHRNMFEDEAYDVGCDAGNWDGGSSASCPHCQLLKEVEEIDKILGKASVASVAVTGKSV